MTLSFNRFEQIGSSKGSNEGGLYRHDSGDKYYLKYPNSERQGYNEIMASAFYREMGFDAAEYEWVDNGMVATPWVPGLPDRSNVADLQASDTVQEAFLPSALIANWDVIGLVADNCLYDPGEMSGPFFLDFGGSFDTRAMGGHKQFSATEVLALEGFTDPSINQSAARAFSAMTPDLWGRSQARIRSLSDSDIRRLCGSGGFDSPAVRAERVQKRRGLLLDTDYEEVF